MRKICSYVAVIIGFTAWSCHNEPDSEKLIDQMVVSTNYDPEADFKAYTTYAIPTDTIGFYSNNSNDTLLISPSSTFPRHVITAIRKELDGRGYQRVTKQEDPDLGVNVMVINDFNVFQDIVYPNYYGYPGHFYPGYYGYGSYYYYPYVNTYAYNTGVLIIELVDLKNRNAKNEVKVVWDAYLGDLYSTIDRNAQSADAIVQAFKQSPYIGK